MPIAAVIEGPLDFRRQAQVSRTLTDDSGRLAPQPPRARARANRPGPGSQDAENRTGGPPRGTLQNAGLNDRALLKVPLIEPWTSAVMLAGHFAVRSSRHEPHTLARR